MTLALCFHPEAESELEAAVDWYDDQQHGLGDDFLELVEEAVELIFELPRVAPVFPGWNRKPVLRTQDRSHFPCRDDSDLHPSWAALFVRC